MLLPHGSCPCGSWRGTVASRVTRCIFVWSHVAPAFKYPGRTLKGRSKYQTVLNIRLLYEKQNRTSRSLKRPRLGGEAGTRRVGGLRVGGRPPPLSERG